MRKYLPVILLVSMMTIPVSAQHVARNFTVKLRNDTLQSQLHVFLPARERAIGRAVLDCPGGGYNHLSMQNEGTDWAEFFCQKGVAWAVLEYAMPKGNSDIPVNDALNAMRMLRDSAEVWHLNPYDIGIMGFSAGGHLASTISTHAPLQCRPDFTILFYPVITMMKNGQHEGSCRNFLGQRRDDEQTCKLYSNDLQVRRHLTPRTVILLANDDVGVPPVTNGVAYYSAMRKAGNECALFVYPKGGHGFGFRTSFPYHEQMINDLSTWLDSLKAPDKEAVRVACIGNSITDGSGIDMAEANGYPAQLQKILGKGYQVRNYGVGARTLLNKGDRPYMKEQAWRDALAFQPHIVIVKLGTNDSKTDNWKHKDEFTSDYQIMIDSLKQLSTRPRIILAYPIKAFQDRWTITDSVITTEVIPLIEKVARDNALEVADLHQIIDDPSMIIADGIHPNAKGAGKMAKALADIIVNKPQVLGKNKKEKKRKNR